MPEEFDDIIREYIDFVNEQVGMYMDALAGFAGHRTRIERQVFRESRPSHKRGDTVVWVSYEDPTKPDIIHTRIIRTEDYISINSRGGSNEQQHASAILVFLYTYWEQETRPRLAKAKGVYVGEIQSDIMGDLREIRNAILHTKRILKEEDYRKLRTLKEMFVPDQRINLSYEDMHKMFGLAKQGVAKLLLNYHGAPEPPGGIEQIVDVAIQKGGKLPK